MQAKTITKPGKILINEKRLPDEWRKAFDFLNLGPALNLNPPVRSFKLDGQRLERDFDHDNDCRRPVMFLEGFPVYHGNEYKFGNDDLVLDFAQVIYERSFTSRGYIVAANLSSLHDHDAYIRKTIQDLLPDKDVWYLSLAGFDIANPTPTFERKQEAEDILTRLATSLKTGIQPLSEFIDASAELHRTKERTQKILFNTKDGREIQAQIIAAADRILGEIRKKMGEATKQSLGDVAQKSIERLNELLANDGEVEFRD